MAEHNFGQMPIYMGCVREEIPTQSDKFWPMTWGIKEDSTFGVINPPPLSEIYLHQHNELVGTTWKRHLDEFSKFVSENAQGRVLEIGSGHGLLAGIVYSKENKITRWDKIEPNPLNETSEFGNFIQGFFPNPEIASESYENIVHSHVLEHTVSPFNFLNDCAQALVAGGRIIASWPNMEKMAENKDLNLLMFEHLTFLPLPEVRAMAKALNLRIIEIKSFEDHSIFICLERTKELGNSEKYISVVDSSTAHAISNEYSVFIANTVKEFNSFINKDSGEVWIFGAHIFTQYLIANGLDIAKIAGIFDNSVDKQGKRLYGTSLKVYAVRELQESGPLKILLPMGYYEKEILDQLRKVLHPGSEVLGVRSGKTLL
jgi:SAM-dependent methyltransferase